MRSEHLRDDLTFNRSAITRDAWVEARRRVAASLSLNFREAFGQVQREYWSSAKGLKAGKVFIVERNARLAALTAEQARIAALRETLATASMIDNTAASYRVREDAAAELAALRRAA